jgi:hypothetical protein
MNRTWMPAMISTPAFFLPPAHSPLRLKSRAQHIQERPPALSFQPSHSMIQSRLDLVIGARSDIAGLVGAAKFIQRLPHNLLSPLWVASLMLVVNRQLLVSLVALPRIAQGTSPKLAGQSEIAVPLREMLDSRPLQAMPHPWSFSNLRGLLGYSYFRVTSVHGLSLRQIRCYTT